MEKIMFVYKITNLITNKSYIGQYSLKYGYNNYFGSGKFIAEDVRTYGKDNFKKETVAICYNKKHLDFLEEFYISFFKTIFPEGYNLTDNGKGKNKKQKGHSINSKHER